MVKEIWRMQGFRAHGLPPLQVDESTRAVSDEGLPVTERKFTDFETARFS
jgi:hypothetical protein